MKRCPRCEESKPEAEFGVCRARPSGLNLYCKRCIREKVADGRQKTRAMKAAQKAEGLTPQEKILDHLALAFRPRLAARIRRHLSPADRVREAISVGAHTQKEIAEVTKLRTDEVCDTLANLLLWTREIRTRIIRNKRMYFVNEPGQVPMREPVRPREPRSYGISNAYTSIYLQDVYAKEA